jgi:predicted transcriptional regulator
VKYPIWRHPFRLNRRKVSPPEAAKTLSLQKRRRSSLEMVRQTLLIAAELNTVTKTDIVYRTRSTFTRATLLLELLVQHALLEKSEVNGIQLYKTTAKGLKVLKAIEFVVSSLRRRPMIPYEEEEYLEFDNLVRELEQTPKVSRP